LAAGVFDIPRRISSFRQGFGRAWDDVPAQTTCLPFGAIGETNSAFSNEVGICLVRVATRVSDASGSSLDFVSAIMAALPGFRIIEERIS
jgi:hypothetical protein